MALRVRQVAVNGERPGARLVETVGESSRCYNTGCPKINETHKIANKYVDFNPIVYIFQI